MRPSEIKQLSNDELGITWEDGHQSHYSWAYLREACPCASCGDCRANGRSLGVDPARIRPFVVNPVGNYAVSFEWNDNHNTGIYPFEYLRRLCPCEACRTA